MNCKVCMMEKLETEFYKGMKTVCKKCHYARCKIRYDNNKDSILEYHKKFYKRTKAEDPERYVKYRQNKKPIIKEKRIAKTQKERYYENPQKYIDFSKSYRDKRLKNDLEFRNKHNIRTSITNAIRKRTKKSKTLMNYGIDILEIYKHVGYKPEGNYHLDHIIPLKLFDFENLDHIKLANSPINLRWITEEQNLKKSDSVEEYVFCNLALLNILNSIQYWRK